jgi:hypothetical protein
MDPGGPRQCSALPGDLDSRMLSAAERVRTPQLCHLCRSEHGEPCRIHAAPPQPRATPAPGSSWKGCWELLERSSPRSLRPWERSPAAEPTLAGLGCDPSVPVRTGSGEGTLEPQPSSTRAHPHRRSGRCSSWMRPLRPWTLPSSTRTRPSPVASGGFGPRLPCSPSVR